MHATMPAVWLAGRRTYGAAVDALPVLAACPSPWPSSRGTTTGSTGGGSRWATRSTTSPSSSAGTLVAQRCSRRTQVWTPPPPSPERTGPQAVPTGCSAGTPSGVCTDHRMRTRAAYGSTAAALRHVVELQNTFRLDRFFLRDTLLVDPSGGAGDRVPGRPGRGPAHAVRRFLPPRP